MFAANLTKSSFLRLPAALLAAALMLTIPALPTFAEQEERPLKIRLRGAMQSSAPSAVTVADLDKLPQVEIDTFDPHQNRQVHYRGVMLRELVAAYALPGTARLEMRAVDGYHIDFLREEWEAKDFILATRMDGNRMSLRESGPAKVVLEYQPKRDNVPNYAPKWIWLVNRIEFFSQ